MWDGMSHSRRRHIRRRVTIKDASLTKAYHFREYVTEFASSEERWLINSNNHVTERSLQVIRWLEKTFAQILTCSHCCNFLKAGSLLGPKSRDILTDKMAVELL